jgi:AraC-like DNA-binding protein
MIMGYFNDIQFLSAMEIPRCTLDVDTRVDDNYSIEFVAGGSMYYQREHDTRHELLAPCLHWHGPGYRYRYGPAGNRGGWQHLFVTFRGERGARMVREGLERLSPGGFLPFDERERLLLIFRQIVQLVQNRAPGYQAHTCVQLETLLWRVENEHRRQDVPTDHRQVIQELVEQIKANPTREITAERMAVRAGLSVSHFRKLFRRHVGQSFHQHLLETRMHLVARQLADPEVRIRELAELFGYTELADFSRAFRRVMGISPRQYRQNLILLCAAE